MVVQCLLTQWHCLFALKLRCDYGAGNVFLGQLLELLDEVFECAKRDFLPAVGGIPCKGVFERVAKGSGMRHHVDGRSISLAGGTLRAASCFTAQVGFKLDSDESASFELQVSVAKRKLCVVLWVLFQKVGLASVLLFLTHVVP